MNKVDLLQEDEVEDKCNEVVEALNWTGPVYRISAIQQKGTELVSQNIMTYLEDRMAKYASDPEVEVSDELHREIVEKEARERIEELFLKRKTKKDQIKDDEDDDDLDVEVEYRE